MVTVYQIFDNAHRNKVGTCDDIADAETWLGEQHDNAKAVFFEIDENGCGDAIVFDWNNRAYQYAFEVTA